MWRCKPSDLSPAVCSADTGRVGQHKLKHQLKQTTPSTVVLVVFVSLHELETHFHIVGIDVIGADDVGIGVLQDDSRVVNFCVVEVKEEEHLVTISTKHVEFHSARRIKEQLTGKNVLVSVFALVFWSLTFLSALFHFGFQLLKSLSGGTDSNSWLDT